LDIGWLLHTERTARMHSPQNIGRNSRPVVSNLLFAARRWDNMVQGCSAKKRSVGTHPKN